jgi:hypothetical protein
VPKARGTAHVKRTQEQAEARRNCVATVVARDKVCQVWAAVTALVAANKPVPPEVVRDGVVRVPRCWGKLTAHEDRGDPVAVCWGHRNWAKSNPSALEALLPK